jgi:hypothetical protein
MIEIINDNLDGFTGYAKLVKKGKRYFVVSSTVAMFTGREVLVFKSNKKGKVTNWSPVCGNRGITTEDAILELDDLYED